MAARARFARVLPSFTCCDCPQRGGSCQAVAVGWSPAQCMRAGCRVAAQGPEKAEGSVRARAQIKDEKKYQALRDKGESKEKAPRIANAGAASSPGKVAAKGGKSGSYQNWSKADLVKRAQEIGIKGRSSMSKAELISALRNH